MSSPAAAESGAGGDAAAAAAPTVAAAAAPSVGDSEEAKRREEQELKEELAKTEEEVATLRQVLTSKQKRAAELRKRLGINVVANLRTDVQVGLRSLTESEVVDRTRRAVLDLGATIERWPAVQRTNSAFKTVGESFSTVGRKIGSVKESAAIKLIQQKVGGAYSSIKLQPSLLNIKPGVKVTGKESEPPGDNAGR